MKKIIFLLVVIASLCHHSLRAQVIASDSLALVDLYNSTRGAEWTHNDNWLSGEVSTWFGVTVDNNRVTKLELCIDCYAGSQGINMQGSIPASIGNLTGLTNLAISGNQLTGGIPTEIGNLTNLTWLQFTLDGLTGEIPTSIGNLTSLGTLQLAANKLTGTLPKEIGDLTQLTNLSVSSNSLIGNIPDEIGNLTSLIQVQASHNQFTGSIPASIGNLTNLLLLSLESNQLTGSIPHEIGNLTQVYGLYLQQNQLSGNIPAEIGNLTGLRTLFLFNNQLTGSIPHEIGNLTLLTNFVAYNNQLSGSLPDEIGNLTALTTLSFYNNNLAGNLPSSLGNLTDLIDLALSDNDLDGPIPSTLGNLTSLDELDLSNNKLTGSIPASLSNLKVARYLVLNDNKLTGAIPAGFGTLPALQYLSLESNQLTDLPDLSTDTNIWHLSLYDNGFTFEDLEPNVSISGISYLPQNITLATPADQNLTEGDDFNIAFAVGGTMNQYVWWKNGYSIAGANQSTFDISSVVIGDAGSYSLTITNSKVPGLFFNTDPVKLSVSAKPAPVIRVERSGVELVNNTGLIFADTTTGSVEEIRFSILNTGNAPLIVSSITAGGDFEVSIATATIAAGDSVSVSCYYKPTKDGQSTSSLIITNNTSLPTFSLTLKGNSFTRKPILSVVNSISFPLTTVGSASIQELSLSNTGDAPLVIYNFKPTGDFATAVSTPITILPNETESVSIQFWPSTEGTLSGSLAISSNADSVAAVVLLTGTGFIQQQPQIDKTYKLTVSNIAQFGNVEVGNDQVNEISLTNSGNTTINIEKIEVTGAFLLVTDFSGPLAAGEVLKIQVAFNPNNIGEHTGTITIISDSDTPTITLNLVGEGVADIEVYNFVSTRVNGKNDFLAIKNITQFPGNIVQIFDRWGNRVYSKSGYNNDDETFRGIDERGKTLPEGTYYYKIDKNNGSEPVLGFLLLRN